ncbi:hypothetical protein AAH979_09150 [Plantactinospora sp. ZYX-F-223]|uniref:DUF2207 family protein n=1 Tax=Plantactinospora sp. ZYX-F-223 TaxID=3144103 RepID=UPI0031FDECEF
MSLADLAVEAGLPVVSLALWSAAYGIARLATRPRGTTPAAPTAEPPGPESPAVVSLLANRWRITPDAARATLLDLAARGHLALRQSGPDPAGTTVHPTGRPADDLNRYERLVLSRVVERAVDGVVPLTALGLHDEQRTRSWTKSFRRLVVADARRLGLSRRRFPATLVTALVAAGCGAALGVAAGAWHYLVRTGGLENEDGDGIFGAIALLVVTATVLGGIARRDHGERDTPAGRSAAARWAGLRAWLGGQAGFADLPPSAVATWGRRLGYGTAFGLTRVVAGVVQLGLANRDLLWSSYGGTWRQIRVSYPSGRLRYGQSLGWITFRAILAALVGGTFTGVLGSLWLGSAEPGAAEGPLDAVGELWVRLSSDPITLGFLLTGLVALGYAGYLALRVLIDLVAPGSVTGEVLWQQVWQRKVVEGSAREYVPVNHYLVIDDGRSDRTRAWVLPEEISGQCRLGEVVTARVRPWTRRVRGVTVHRPARSAPGGTAAADRFGPDPGVDDGDRIGSDGLLSAEEIGWALGRPVRSASTAGYPDDRPWSAEFTDLHGRPALTVTVARGRSGRVLLTLVRAVGRPLAGTGDEAYLGADRLVGRRGDVVVLLQPGRDVAPDRLTGLLDTALSRASARQTDSA